MKVYVVTVNGKISSEGYAELEDAQAFVERRTDRPEKITPMKYQAVGNEYLIIDVDIVQPRRYGDYAVTAKSAEIAKLNTDLKSYAKLRETDKLNTDLKSYAKLREIAKLNADLKSYAASNLKI